MPNVHGFAPVAARDARVLVLGTAPGKASLEAGEYYAHPRNLFWRLTAAIFEFDAVLAYGARLACLTDAKLALWDVLQHCTRASSLDSDIVEPVPNDFVAFFKLHPRIERVCFNGVAAAKHYRTHVRPTLAPSLRVDEVILPSTSPANAATSYVAKLASWSMIKIR